MESSEQHVAAPPDPGGMLRAAREAMGISQREMADRLNWMPMYVVAVEENRFEVLRGAAFVRGYLRAYGKLVNVSEEALMASYGGLQAHADSPAEAPRRVETRVPQVHKMGIAIPAGIAIVVLLVLGLWWMQGSEPQREASRTVAVADPAAVSSALDRGEPSAPDGEPSAQEGEFSAQLEEPSAQDMEPSAQGMEPSAQGMEPSAQGMEPSAQGLEPAAQNVAPTAESATQPDTLLSAGTTNAVGAEPQLAGATPGVDGADPAAQAAAAPDTPAMPPPARQQSIIDSSLANPGDGALLEFAFNGDCWVEVRNGQGKLVFADLLRQGDTVNLTGLPPFDILFGDARHVNLQYQGQPVDIVRRPGRVMARIAVGE